MQLFRKVSPFEKSVQQYFEPKAKHKLTETQVFHLNHSESLKLSEWNFTLWWFAELQKPLRQSLPHAPRGEPAKPEPHHPVAAIREFP